MHSAIYSGKVRHRRHSPKQHEFAYPMYMLALDLDELEYLHKTFRFFSIERFAPLTFKRKDYLFNPKQRLKDEALSTAQQLGANTDDIDKVILVGQVRCFGIYFSPVNFYFFYKSDKALYMIAEVRNTPWNEKHCYLVDINTPSPCKKVFHVSPFMGMDMNYHWRIHPPVLNIRNSGSNLDKQLLVHIENWNQQKLFDATLTLKHQAFSTQAIKGTLMQWPLMTISIIKGIYWQALKLFVKAVPCHGHPKAE